MKEKEESKEVRRIRKEMIGEKRITGVRRKVKER